tara:strand:+ start:1150 stop:2130 length:981 start_codon:yes stop_codon:yes gene_type:complete
MNEKLIGILEQFRNKKIAVVGDIMVDKYIWGSVKRVSPEAPVQVVNVEKENYAPGAAANVANNVTALNAGAHIVGVVGNDSAKNRLLSQLEEMKIITNGIVINKDKPTIQKVRILGQHQQLLRVDYEKKGQSDGPTEKELIKNIKSLIDDVDAIVVSDYGKGVITKSVMKNIIELSKKENKMVIVDPKPQNFKYYKNVNLITPNHDEAVDMANLLGEISEDIDKIGGVLLKELDTTLLITEGEKGMSLFESEGKIVHIPTKAKEVFDVTGAGDTVVAVLALSLCSGATMKESAILANHAAGIVVGKIGTSTVTVDEIKKSLETENE